MNWDIPVDIYCERVDAAFWSEPINAITNAAFLIAAYLALRSYRAGDTHDRLLQFLIVTVALIGLGSFAFHTMATRGAVLLDVIPITVFVYAYLFLALRRYVGMKAAAALLVLGACCYVNGPVGARPARLAEWFGRLFATACSSLRRGPVVPPSRRAPQRISCRCNIYAVVIAAHH